MADPAPVAGTIWTREDVAAYFDPDPLASAWRLKGEQVRAVAGRETLRVILGG